MNALTRIMTTRIDNAALNKAPLVAHGVCGTAANWLRTRRRRLQKRGK